MSQVSLQCREQDLPVGRIRQVAVRDQSLRVVDMLAKPDHVGEDLRLVDRRALQFVFRRLGLLCVRSQLLQAFAYLRRVRIQLCKQLLFCRAGQGRKYGAAGAGSSCLLIPALAFQMF